MERRKYDRFSVPGAQVVYKLSNGEAGMAPLIDMAKCSARFSAHHFVHLGEEIDLEILIPEKNNITITGNVVRLADPHQEKMTGAVVQFLPFGTLEGYNSFRTYNQLSTLVRQYIRN